MFEDAVQLTPDGHPDKPVRLISLSNSLFCRFERLDDLSDLNRSILILEDTVKLTPDSYPGKPSMLNNLGNSLSSRFERLGDLNDLNWSILMLEDAVRLTADGHPDKPRKLNSLGNSLLGRFERLSDLSDLNRSILMKENAVQLTPDGHPDKPGRLNNLGISLWGRFVRLGNLSDLTRSILTKEDAVQLTPDGHPDKPGRLNSLGISLLGRFKRLGDLSDLDRSILMVEDAVQLTADDNPDKLGRLISLGNTLLGRFNRFHDVSDLNRSICHYSSAAHSVIGPAHVRFNAAAHWAKCAKIQNDQLTHLEPYSVAMQILPELAWLGLSITDRHHHLLKAGAVVRDAAAAAVTSGDPQKAVEWLEQGRSIIWSQLLNLRTPITALSNSHPLLANELITLSSQLDQAGSHTTDSPPIWSGTEQSLQSIANQAHENAVAQDNLLKKIRALEGFERFMLPKPITELSTAAHRGPVIILNSTNSQCDALILRPNHGDKVIHVPLPHFNSADVASMVQSFSHLVRGSGPSRLGARREGQLNSEEEFEQTLSKLWEDIVRPVLNRLGMLTPSKTNLPRIWWCPTGPLSFLPIHAAGLYGKHDTFGSKLSDYAISSYTPSLTALMEAARPHTEPTNTMQLLAVAQPSALGQTYIAGTMEEIDHIQRIVNGRISILRLEKDMATVKDVQQGMRDSRWVHFACHGVQNVLHPTESALLLAQNSCLALSNIIQLELPHADFAFLSACQTAMGDKDLQEESVHLAAGMLLAGYRGVIATMWTIMDTDAPQVTSDVYEYLFKTSPPDTTQAAEALHLAVQKLRNGSKKSFSHWVPFIHVGV
ncbi:CHAT domain-containing protein [Mycena galopus ATCC 62051]|nr:CHAT domain-containing protein [Mycena galopus ATCC 62051]